jgi:hypothetical protein
MNCVRQIYQAAKIQMPLALERRTFGVYILGALSNHRELAVIASDEPVSRGSRHRPRRLNGAVVPRLGAFAASAPAQLCGPMLGRPKATKLGHARIPPRGKDWMTTVLEVVDSIAHCQNVAVYRHGDG